MTDLETRLRDLRVPAPPVSDEVVRADVARARRALHRRRLTRVGSGGVAVAAVGVLAAVVVAGQSGGQSGERPDVATPPASGHLRLVDYTGAQQPGFTVAKVPAGFVLQGATPYSLDVARADDHSSLDVFSGKLTVMLQSKDATLRHTDHPVTVHGTTGYLHTEKGVATTLEYLDGGHDVIVQAWADLGLTDAQLVEFANGVTVSDSAQASVG
ncbi:hypothetical protein [Nocardioides sp.]|jgi:hypothetical protein|uniref:hypothetical protein n=1 Tax=Nocardioides sp. TaxID=35761 RepID=UPI002BE3EDD2|nr:hypothetical protein [Nocardioides sp.]HVX55262.1 hypothetical protein [Nocardioides sp.]